MKNRAYSIVALVGCIYLLGYLVPRFSMSSWVHRTGMLMLDYGGLPIKKTPVKPLNKMADWYDILYAPFQAADEKLTQNYCSPWIHNGFNISVDYKF